MTISDFVRKIIQYDKFDVEAFYVDEYSNGEEVFVARVRLFDDECYRCPICGERGEKHGYKQGRVKRWRSLDIGKNRFYIESELARVRCKECGVHAQKMPWALPNFATVATRVSRMFKKCTSTASHQRRKRRTVSEDTEPYFAEHLPLMAFSMTSALYRLYGTNISGNS